jgi:riboflavin biosynthesis pyrimidine reductase
MIGLELKDLKPGMVLAEQVRNSQGVTLLTRGKILDERNIRIMKAWGVGRIWVEGGAETEGSESASAEKDAELIEAALRAKFAGNTDDPVMEAIMKTAGKRLLFRRETEARRRNAEQ